jgi:hypothetical protein
MMRTTRSGKSSNRKAIISQMEGKKERKKKEEHRGKVYDVLGRSLKSPT